MFEADGIFLILDFLSSKLKCFSVTENHGLEQGFLFHGNCAQDSQGICYFLSFSRCIVENVEHNDFNEVVFTCV